VHLEVKPWGIEWSDTLSISNPEIDEKRQYFVKLVNELNGEITNQRRDKVNLERIMGLMLENTIAQFSHEEQLFEEKSYPAAQEHAQIHSELISKFRQALIDIHDTELVMVWIGTSLTIKNLLYNHILFEDARYIEYLRAEKRL